MDHLPLPNDPVLADSFEVPFYATEAYDGKDFKTFPNRHKWQVSATSATRDGKSASDAEVGAMLHTWLFFGLLFAVTGENQDLDAFRRVNAQDRHILSTELLGKIVSEWSQRLINEEWSYHQDSLQRWGATTYECLIEARHIMLLIKANPRFAELDSLCMSVAALGEYLIQAIKDIFIKRGLESPVEQRWRVPGFADCCEPLLKAMMDRGWCRNKLATLDAATVMSVGELWFFANMLPPKPDLSHENCQVSSCVHSKVDESHYSLSHKTEICDKICSLEGPSPIAVEGALADGVIPLIEVARLDGGGNARTKLSIEVVPFSKDVEFTAISHVWSDGHGNPGENKLPHCFLTRLIRVLDTLPSSKETDKVAFWMDTLCVPVEKGKSKDTAIRLLKEPYANAKHVLVIDSYLEALDSAKMSVIEVVGRIEASSWSHRLWTFQEGRIGRRVWFLFRDRAIELFDMVEISWREQFFRIPSLASHSVELGILFRYNSSKIWESQELQNLFTRLPYIRHSLCRRSTSKPKDEAICLASIMSVPMQPIIDAPDDKKMYKFWSLLPHIPRGMVFSKASKKLTAEGLRWAPESMMADLEVSRWGGPTGLFEDMLATATPQGLSVDLHTWAIGPKETRMPQTPVQRRQSWTNLIRLFNENTSQLGSFVLYDEAGGWYKCVLEKNWHQTPVDIDNSEEVIVLVAYSRKSISVLLEDGPHNKLWPIEGVLATYRPKAQTDTGRTLARAHRHVWLSRASPDEAELWGKLCALTEEITCNLESCEDVGAGEHHDLEFENVAKERLLAAVSADPSLLELGKRINEFQHENTSEEAVMGDFRSSIRVFAMLCPWISISLGEDSPQQYCIQ